jgi:hypothetical protein
MPSCRGRHICQVFTTGEERLAALFDFIRTGLRLGEQTCCITQKPTDEILDEFLADFGLSLNGVKSTGQFHSGINRDFYLAGGGFDQRRVLGQWETMFAQARARSAAGLCAVAEVLADLSYLKGGTQLTIYETQLEEWMQRRPVTIVCQYDARAFDACTIMNVLKVHPLVLANGRVAASPFYTAAERRKSH